MQHVPVVVGGAAAAVVVCRGAVVPVGRARKHAGEELGGEGSESPSFSLSLSLALPISPGARRWGMVVLTTLDSGTMRVVIKAGQFS